MQRILKGDQNLALIRLHETHGEILHRFVLRPIIYHGILGHFVRISYNEVSVSHPDAIKKVLLARLHKVYWHSIENADNVISDPSQADWYKIHALPDYRFQFPMSITDPKHKVEKSKYIASA